MHELVTGPPPEIDIDQIILIVVGAHLAAEMTDRPIGYRLREQILRWIDEHTEDDDDSITIHDEAGNELIANMPPLAPLVCTDLWYLNNEELLQRPTIAIGNPGVNAATAFLANRLPQAFVLENTLQVLLDVEFAKLHSCMWGVDQAATVSAVDVFAERYLTEFLMYSHEGM